MIITERQRIEARYNWQATFRRTRPGVRHPLVCLMRTITGSFYWETPDYKGVFAWGATYSFDPRNTAGFLADGTLELVSGNLPECLKPVAC